MDVMGAVSQGWLWMLWGVLRILRGWGAKFKKLASDVRNTAQRAAERR
jgi:hypothetical protein